MTAVVTFIRRALAYLADGMLVFFASRVVLRAPTVWFGEVSTGVYLTLHFLQPLIVAAYFVVGHWRYGRTFGKFIVGLRVVGPDAGKLSLVRAVVRYIPFFIGTLGFALIDTKVGQPASVSLGAESVDLWTITFAAWIAAEALTCAYTKGQRSIHDLMAQTWVRGTS